MNRRVLVLVSLSLCILLSGRRAWAAWSCLCRSGIYSNAIVDAHFREETKDFGFRGVVFFVEQTPRFLESEMGFGDGVLVQAFSLDSRVVICVADVDKGRASIDGREYDLKRGCVFLIPRRGKETQIPESPDYFRQVPRAQAEQQHEVFDGLVKSLREKYEAIQQFCKTCVLRPEAPEEKLSSEERIKRLQDRARRNSQVD